MPEPDDLATPLRRYWGYESFRPLQEQVVRSLVAGHDTCVIMPTGGGKSLCYQLPAVVLEKTAIVISPLIALMQDQAAQLDLMGIPAAVLNSFVTPAEQSRVQREARAGKFRLLYLSPERLARADTLSWLKQVPISFFAIDEAHCISEWGHEFRPEYRQLKSLREHFPTAPIAAFTASATQRVRHDILDQLKLRSPDKYIASFHRPNLRYMVRECDGHEQSSLLLQAMRHYEGSNVIVYAPTRDSVGETVDLLQENDIPAVGYHGQMDATARRRNQERWTSDEVKVMVGTIAFGLGINKASVRAVIHLSLPKSIEQYYQEAGRAGRDGLSADCVMLWQRKDAALLAYFVKQIQDPTEQQRAWKRYHQIHDFVEQLRCRHQQICLHFGETPKWSSCKGCDVCASPLEWMIPRGSRPPKRRKQLSQGSSDSAGLEPSQRTKAAPRERGDSELHEYLRQWRREAALELKMPAFVVMHDSSLEEICRQLPKSLEEMRNITGFGERKTERYGQSVLDALKRFQEGVRPTPAVVSKIRPADETIQLLAEGKTLAEIATIRQRELGTVVGVVAELIEKHRVEFQDVWCNPERRALVEAACEQVGSDFLRPLKDALPEDFTFEEIRLVMALHRRKTQDSSSVTP